MHKRNRTIGAVAVLALAVGVHVGPASAGLTSHRTATHASVERVANYPIGNGHTVTYTAQASEVGQAGDTSLITIACQASTPLYFVHPHSTEITPKCRLRDDSTGRTYSAMDTTPSIGAPATVATSVFSVPTSRPYSVCMSVLLWGVGYEGPTRCASLF